MPVVINCSWCNKTMGSIALENIRDWDKGEICGECLGKKDDTVKTFESVVARTKAKADRMYNEALQMLEREIKKLAKE